MLWLSIKHQPSAQQSSIMGKMAGIIHFQMYPKDQKDLKRKKRIKKKIREPQTPAFLWVTAVLKMCLLYSVPSWVLQNSHEVINRRMPDAKTLCLISHVPLYPVILLQLASTVLWVYQIHSSTWGEFSALGVPWVQNVLPKDICRVYLLLSSSPSFQGPLLTEGFPDSPYLKLQTTAPHSDSLHSFSWTIFTP